MSNFEEPSSSEQEEMLVRLYYGPGTNVERCAKKAYYTFNRTLRRVGDTGLKGAREEATQMLQFALENLPAERIDSQADFDSWHREQVERLQSIYSKHGQELYVGQAQKWINMALKHVYILGEDRLPGYRKLYRLAHVPIDNVVLSKFRSYGRPHLTTAWSKIKTYEEYLDFQSWIRETFRDSAPLAVEFHLWREGMSKP